VIADDLLLLITDDATGKARAEAGSIDYALAGAVLAELDLLRRIRLTTEADVHHKKNRVVVTDGSSTGDPILDHALAILAEKDLKPYNAIHRLQKGLRRTLYERLAAAGVLSEETGRVLGVFPSRRWPAADPGPESSLRRTLDSVFLDGVTPTARTAALIACLSVAGMAHKVVAQSHPAVDPRRVTREAKGYRERNWAAHAARYAYEADAAATAGGAA